MSTFLSSLTQPRCCRCENLLRCYENRVREFAILRNNRNIYNVEEFARATQIADIELDAYVEKTITSASRRLVEYNILEQFIVKFANQHVHHKDVHQLRNVKVSRKIVFNDL
ncbi:hypothetical protein HT594_00136 [Phenacoccus solenopsis nudivirus]|nr:hypothetical protein HT594_00136 [Phenacoccus solenopsis nudivirus]